MKKVCKKIIILMIITLYASTYVSAYTETSWESYYDFTNNKVKTSSIDSIVSSSEGNDWIIYEKQKVIDPIKEDTIKKWSKEKINQYAKVVDYILKKANLIRNKTDAIQNAITSFGQRARFLINNVTDEEQKKDLEQSAENAGDRKDDYTASQGGSTGNTGSILDTDEVNKDKPSTGQLGNMDASATHTPDEIISEAQGFINKGSSGQSTVNGANLKAGSNTLYNILLTIGIITAVLVGVYLGAKFIMASAEDKAKVKESLIPYIAGCVVIFGAFIIWRLAINLLSAIDKTAKMEYNIEYRIAKSTQNDVDFNIFS